MANKPTEQPFVKDEIVMVHHAFGQGVSGKYAIVEGCFKSEDACESGWMVKIDTYPNPIDSNWLIKKP